MKKVGTWILNHGKLVLAILVFGITLIAIGGVMLGSRLSYKAYEARYNANDLAVRSTSPAQPKTIEINNAFKSSQKKKIAFSADELTVTTSQTEYMVGDYIDLTQTGGSIFIKLELEETSFVDIDFEIATEYQGQGDEAPGIKDLLSNAQFIVNGETMEEVIDLPADSWQHLIMLGFALPAGDVTVEIKSMSGKNALMPQLRNVTFFSSQVLSLAE